MFLLKASQDELILDKLLDDNDFADEVWGFHAQHAAKKLRNKFPNAPTISGNKITLQVSSDKALYQLS